MHYDGSLVIKGLLALALIATAGVLMMGLISFSKEAAQASLYRNKLMYWRVVCQGVAIALFSLLLFMDGR